MTTYPQVQFVSAPETGATVLYDFNDDATVGAKARVMRSGFTLGSPSLLGDPDGLGVEYGPRTVAFTQEISGTRGQALAAQASLARAFMLRRRGWLRVQLDELSEPHWLRTYTPTPGELDFSLVFIERDTDTWRIGVQVAAEPLIRDERITFSAVTITNDPAAATRPMSYLLPDIIGDAPAPLRISATFSSIMDACDIYWASTTVPAGVTKPIFWQVGGADGWTAGADTGASETVATYSGGTMRRCTFATTPQMWLRLSGTAPSIPYVGRHRLFVRVARTSLGASHYKLQATITASLPATGSPAGITTPVVSWQRAANTTDVLHVWVDLGSFELPLPRTDMDLAPVATTPVVCLYAEEVSGAGDLVFDCYALVPEAPAEVTTLEDWEKSSTLVSEFPGVGPSQTEPQVWDGDAEATLRIRTSGALDANISGPMRGQFPRVHPGHNNLVTLIGQTRLLDPTDAGANNRDLITITSSVVFSYQPRLLWIGE